MSTVSASSSQFPHTASAGQEALHEARASVVEKILDPNMSLTPADIDWLRHQPNYLDTLESLRGQFDELRSDLHEASMKAALKQSIIDPETFSQILARIRQQATGLAAVGATPASAARPVASSTQAPSTFERRFTADFFDQAHISTSSAERFRTSGVSANSGLYLVLNAFKTELRILMDATIFAVDRAATPATPAFQAPAALSGPAARVLDSSDEDEVALTTTTSTGGTAPARHGSAAAALPTPFAGAAPLALPAPPSISLRDSATTPKAPEGSVFSARAQAISTQFGAPLPVQSFHASQRSSATALPAYPSPSLRPGAAAAAARMGATPAPVGTTAFAGPTATTGYRAYETATTTTGDAAASTSFGAAATFASTDMEATTQFGATAAATLTTTTSTSTTTTAPATSSGAK
jgi:hypothetical protein